MVATGCLQFDLTEIAINNLVKELIRNVQYSIKLLRSSTDYMRIKNKMKKPEDKVISVYSRQPNLPTTKSSQYVPKTGGEKPRFSLQYI